MQVITTNKGNASLLYGGYAYRKYRQKLDGAITWVCSKERSKKCRGRLISKGEQILKAVEHQCGVPEDAQLEVRKRVFQAKKRAREEGTPIPRVCTEETRDLYSKGYEFVTEMPNQNTLMRCLYRHRSRSQGKPKETKNSVDVVQDETYVLY